MRNSKELPSIIAEHTPPKDEVLVSFNVVSLLINVLTNLAISVVCKRLLEDETVEERTCLGVEEIVMLLQLCLDPTYLCFTGEYYRQTFRTAMGSPVSATVANLVMEEIEQ